MKKYLFPAIFALSISLVGCTGDKPHEHTFSEEWSKNDSSHWHNATCDHTNLVSNLSDHEYGDDNVCDVCGYIKTVPDVILPKYTVSFNTNYGSYIPIQFVTEGNKAIQPNNPTRDGKAFYNWYDNPEFTGEPYDFDTKVMGDITLYARWGYELKFMHYDLSVYKSSILLENELIEKPADPAVVNMTFDGWYSDLEFENEFIFDEGITCNTTIYSSFGYRVTFLKDNGDFYKTIVVKEGRSIGEVDHPEKEYFTFTDWCVDSDLQVGYDIDTPVTDNINLYARYSGNFYTINYHNMEDVPNSNPECYQHTVGLDELADPGTNEGFWFYGWYFDPEFKKPCTSIPADAHETIDLYAKFLEVYKVTYENWPEEFDNPNGVYFTVESNIIFNTKIFEQYPGIEFTGYRYNDKYITSTAGFEGDFTVAVDTSYMSSTITFDAGLDGQIYPSNPYIYLDYCMEDILPVRQSAETDLAEHSDGFNPNEAWIPEREGYVFRGWYTDSSYFCPLSETETNYVDNGATLYAKWELIPEGHLYLLDGYGYGNDEPSFVDTPIRREFEASLEVPFQYTKFNAKMFGYCDTGSNSMSIYGNDPITGQHAELFSSSNSGNYLYEYPVLDLSKTSTITAQYHMNCPLQGHREWIHFNYIFSPAETRKQFVKVQPTDQVVLNVRYLGLLGIDACVREGYEFDGWQLNDDIIDLNGPWTFAETEAHLTARWIPIEAKK